MNWRQLVKAADVSR